MKDRLEQSDLEIFMIDLLSDPTPNGYLSPPRKEPGIFPLLANCVNHYSVEPLNKGQQDNGSNF